MMQPHSGIGIVASQKHAQSKTSLIAVHDALIAFWPHSGLLDEKVR
jgi:hypothetical protein